MAEDVQGLADEATKLLAMETLSRLLDDSLRFQADLTHTNEVLRDQIKTLRKDNKALSNSLSIYSHDVHQLQLSEKSESSVDYQAMTTQYGTSNNGGGCGDYPASNAEADETLTVLSLLGNSLRFLADLMQKNEELRDQIKRQMDDNRALNNSLSVYAKLDAQPSPSPFTKHSRRSSCKFRLLSRCFFFS